MKNYMEYKCKLGTLYLGEEGGMLTLTVFNKNDPRLLGYAKHPAPILQDAAKQLDEYFSGARQRFELPLKPKGTAFQTRVWYALQEIPYGDTRTYKDIAQVVNCPKGSRAVGLANNRNPISIIIPCHRVVGQNGQLTGYAGGLDFKKHLLELEQMYV